MLRAVRVTDYMMEEASVTVLTRFSLLSNPAIAQERKVRHCVTARLNSMDFDVLHSARGSFRKHEHLCRQSKNTSMKLRWYKINYSRPIFEV
jgi:hypothetical protein